LRVVSISLQGPRPRLERCRPQGRRAQETPGARDAGRKRRRAKKELISSADQKTTRTSTIRLGTVAEAVLKQPSHP